MSFSYNSDNLSKIKFTISFFAVNDGVFALR